MERKNDENIKSLNDLIPESKGPCCQDDERLGYESALFDVNELLKRKKEQLQKEYTAYNAAKINLINELLK